MGHSCCNKKHKNQEGLAKDPVCGMDVDPKNTEHHLIFEDKNYHFCSDKCLHKFEHSPHDYLGKKKEVPVIAGAIYTCPMHPEIEQVGAGDCPICGMALEPKDVAIGEEGPNPELVDFNRRFWVGVALSAPLLILSMSPYVGLSGIREFFGERLTLWTEFALGTPVILWSGWPFFVRGYNSFCSMNLNMFSLISMGTGAAYIFSIFAVLVPDIFPDGFRNKDGNVGVYFEAGAVIITLVLLGQIMELRARERTGSAIKALLYTHFLSWGSFWIFNLEARHVFPCHTQN